jgi:hypothetical protein
LKYDCLFFDDSPILNNIVDKLHIVPLHGSAFFTTAIFLHLQTYLLGWLCHTAEWAISTEQRVVYVQVLAGLALVGALSRTPW